MKYDFNTLHLLWAIRSIPKSVVNGHEKAILNILLSCAGNQNDSWYSLSALAEATCFSLDTVRRNLRTLEQKKLITITKPSKYNRTSSNHYALSVDLIMTYCPVEKDSYQQPLHAERVADSKERVADSYGERVADSTTKKEIKERKKKGAERPSDEGARASYPPGFVTAEQYYAELAADPVRMAARAKKIAEQEARMGRKSEQPLHH